jgi:hypothetical protein
MYLSCFPLFLHAQQPGKDTLLTRELILEKEYNPTIRDASRLNTLPEIVDPTVPKTKVNYANYALPFDVQPQLSILKANEWFTNVKESGKRGYAVAGIASNQNINGDLGYQILREEKTRLDIFYSHRSANSKVSYLQDDTRQRMKVNDNLGGIRFAHAFEPFTLSARLKYTDARYNDYGYKLPALQSPFYTPADRTVNRENKLLNIDLSVISESERNINYRIDLNISDFRQKYITKAPEEVFVHAGWDVNKFFGDMRLGIDGYVNIISYLNRRTYDTGYNDYGQLSFNPYAGYEGDNWKIRLGAKAHFYISQKKSLSYAPNVAVSVCPFSDSEIYMNIDGGVTSNALRSMFYENRYVSTSYRVPDSRSPMDAVLGWKNNLPGIGWIDVFAGYAIIKDEHFFVPNYVSPLYSNPADRTIIDIITDIRDVNLLKAGLRAKYQYQDIVEAGIKVQYNHWDVKDTPSMGFISAPAWNRPAIEMDFNAAYTFNIPLRLDLMYHLETGRKALGFQSPYLRIEDMKDIHELSLKANYTFNDAFSVFAQGNNLLLQKYDLWYGYPSQGFNVMIGGSIKF